MRRDGVLIDFRKLIIAITTVEEETHSGLNLLIAMLRDTSRTTLVKKVKRVKRAKRVKRVKRLKESRGTETCQVLSGLRPARVPLPKLVLYTA